MATELLYALGLHFIGDYITQNHWIATNKTKRTDVALLHALLYSIPFLFLVQGNAWTILCASHYYIDRYRLAQYWIRLINWNWSGDNFGFPEETPRYLSVWLLFIIDNIFHIIINSLCIIYGNK